MKGPGTEVITPEHVAWASPWAEARTQWDCGLCFCRRVSLWYRAGETPRFGTGSWKRETGTEGYKAEEFGSGNTETGVIERETK